MDKIELSLPGLFLFDDLNISLIEMMEQTPYKFRENVFVGSVFGSPNTVWNGGRVIEGGYDHRELKRLIEFYNERGIPLRLTFTNCFTKEETLNDTIGNNILECLKNNQLIKNDINVGTTVMLEYIEKKYRDLFRIIISTTLCLKTKEDIEKYSDKYIVVPDYSLNNNIELLETINNKQNLELLANETCIDNCPYRRKHYENYSLCQRGEMLEPMQCKFPSDGNYYRTIAKRKHHISIEDANNIYLPIGINKFKIAGRGLMITTVIESYVNYLVKPEYKDEVRLDLFNSVLIM